MLLLNFLTPRWGDDFNHSAARSLPDVFRLVAEHYQRANGRIVTHFFAYLLMPLHKGIFNLLNSLFYVCLTLLVYRFANPGKTCHLPLYLCIVTGLWLAIVNYGQTVLWAAGAVNYLWGTVSILFFLAPYVLRIQSAFRFKGRIFPLVGMVFLGVVMGTCSENTSVAAILLAIAFTVYLKLAKSKIEAWMICAPIGGVIGFAINLLAPGNSARLSGADVERSFIEQMGIRLTAISMGILEHFSVIIVLFIILFFAMVMFARDNGRVFLSLSFFIASMASAYALVLAPTGEARAFFGPVVFLVIACAICLASFSMEKAAEKFAIFSFIAVLSFFFLITSAVAVIDITDGRLRADRGREHILSEVEAGNKHIVLPEKSIPRPRTKWNPLYGLATIEEDHTWWVNFQFVKYYGLDSIRREASGDR